MIEKLEHLFEVSGARIDQMMFDRAELRRRGWRAPPAAAASMPPVSTVTVMTGR